MVVVIRPFYFGEQMTVPVSDRLSQLYVGNGTNTRFDFTFRVFDQEDENGVTVRVKTGTEFEDMDKTMYQVNINQDEMGGYVTFNTAPNDQTFFYVAGQTPIDQLLDITNYDNFYPDAIERSLDKLTAILQEWNHLLSSEAQSRILADINYDALSQARDNELKAYIDGLVSSISGEPILGVQFITTVETIADLQYLLRWDGRTVYVKGYYAPTNLALAQPYKGGGTRIYVASRSNENDGFLCINGWVLQVENSTVSPSHAGGKNDTSFDSSDAVQKALLYAGETLLDDYYYTKKPVWFPVSKVIKGVGKWSCGLVKNGDDSVLSLVHDKTTGRTVLDKNAVLIGYADRPNTTYCEELRLSDFSLKYTGSLTNSIGLYIPTLCRSIFSNLLIEDVSIGVKTSDSWLCSWINVHVRNSDISFKFGDSDGTLIANGTSNNMIGCYAEGVKLNAYWFKNYQYSTMSGCAADKVSHMQDGGSSIYVFDNTDMIINNAGCEHITTRHLIAKNGSNIVFNLGNFILDNKFQDETTWWQQTNTLLSISNESKVTFNNTKFSISNQTRSELSKFAAFACVDGGCKLELNNISSYTSQIVNFVEASEYKTYNSLDIYYVSGSIIEMKTPLDVYEYAANGGRSQWFNATAKTRRLVDTFKSYSSNAFAIPTDISLTQLSNTYQTVVAAQTSPAAATAALEYPYPNTAHLIYQMSAKRHAGDNLLAQLAIPIWTANNTGQGALRIRYKQGSSNFSSFRTIFTDDDSIIPRVTASRTLGSSSLTWNNIYSQNAVTVVSDKRYKTGISELNEQEINCAIACSKLYRKYKLNAAVDEKGNNAARYHIGAIAQEIIQCFTDHGLDWHEYGVVTYEAWESSDNHEAGEIYMVRYEELNCFVNAGFEYRLSKLEV